ncbi:MAG: hypothetical protein P8J26_10010, partial [Pseudomonadales bacterium]|nr:hypothetical protein [Pseudomonadales bacterium]
ENSCYLHLVLGCDYRASQVASPKEKALADQDSHYHRDFCFLASCVVGVTKFRMTERCPAMIWLISFSIH